jgi:hypothetical protein
MSALKNCSSPILRGYSRLRHDTEVEVKEKKARVEDALNATRAAVEEVVVPGGGDMGGMM